MNELANGLETVKIIDSSYDLEGREIVCYPNHILTFKVSIHRLFMKPRILYSTITVDMVKGNAARSNMFPEHKTIEISKQSLVPTLIKEETAIEEAKKVIIKWARHKFRVYKAPEIEIAKQEKLYKVFFYAEVNNEPMIVDSIKGVEMK